MCNTSVRVASQVLVCFCFFCVVGSVLSQVSWTILVTVLVSLVSRQVLNTCVRNVDICFCPSPCLCRSGAEFICCFFICAQIEKCSQVFPLCLQKRFKNCFFVSPSGKVLRLFATIHTSSFGVCPLGKFCQELKFCLFRSEARESAHSEQCESHG